MTNASNWSEGQIRLFVKDVRKLTGDAWKWMVPDVRRALVDSKALSIIASQERESVTVDSINELRIRMHVEAGTEE